jgi:segregation and condensation protein B
MAEEIEKIEAILFTTGKGVSADELADYTGINRKKIKEYIEQLIKSYMERSTALEILQIGTKYMMQLKPKYADVVRRVAPPEISSKTLKTAALIAYHQPILQSRLQKMVGARVYGDVKLLQNLGLINMKNVGRTFEITTSKTFTEYFGIPAVDKVAIKKWIAQKAGLKISEK